MKEFINNHPIITLLLGVAALGTIEAVLRKPAVVVAPQQSGHFGLDADIPVVSPMAGVPGFDGYGTEQG